MERWQREHIRKNLTNLQEWTTCNELFLSYLREQNVLSLADVDILRTTEGKGKLAQSSLLYQILETKKGAYKILIDTLDKYRQSGAPDILLKGNNVVHPNSPTTILNANVPFQDQVFNLKELLPGLTETVLEDILKNLESLDDLLGPAILTSNMFVLAKNTIPSMPPIYIPRSISKRKTINPEIFRQNCTDVFVFKGIDQIQLNWLVNRPTSTSSQQILEVTSKFIVLEHEKDWDEIQTVSKSSTHLIRVEKAAEDTNLDKLEFLLEASTGGSSVLSKPSEDERVTIFDDDFIDTINKEADVLGYCICDTPGMGKSFVLANVARKLARENPKEIVAFIPLSQLILKDDAKISDHEKVKKILGLISASKFSQEILLWAVMSKTINLKIFFDGLDEVPFDELDFTKHFLKGLSRSGLNLTMFVTSRPHLRQELEQTLGVISYDLAPFTHENQMEFLLTFWKQKNSTSDKTKLLTFATFCLNGLQDNDGEQESDIMGIPLQCLLLAEFHAKAAQVFCDPARNRETPVIKFVSIYEMYSKFVDLRLGKIKENGVTSLNAEKMWKFHVWKSVELLFPELAENFVLLEKVDKNIPISDYCSFGLLQNENQSDSFIHRTIAEFLFADYLVQFLANKSHHSWNDNVKIQLQYFSKHVFLPRKHQWRTMDLSSNNKNEIVSIFEFNHGTIFYFVNGIVSLKLLDSQDGIWTSNVVSIMQPTGFFMILQCSIFHNFVYLFRFLVNILKIFRKQTFNKIRNHFTGTRNIFDKIFNRNKKLEIPPYCVLLTVAAMFAKVDIMDEIFRLFNEVLKFDLDYCCHHWKWQPSPLLEAVERGSYEVVEYLADKFSFDLDNLINTCVRHSHTRIAENAKNKFKICKLLYSKKHRLEQHDVASVNEDICKYFLQYWLHAEFYKYFIRESKNVFETNDKKSIVYYAACLSTSSNDFHELCRMLIKERKVAPIFQQNPQKWKSPCHWILKNVKNLQVDTFEMILDNAEINVNTLDDDKDGMGNNLIQSAVEGMQSLDMIKMLVGRGANYNCKNEEGMTSLHLSAIKYLWYLEWITDLEVIKYLINICDDICATDIYDRNFLHYVADNVADEKFEELTAFISVHPQASIVLNAKDELGQTPVQRKQNRKKK